MSKYDPTTCYLCNVLPLAICDGCGNRICFEHRAGTWPRPNGGGVRLDYCTVCLTDSNAPAPLPL